MPNAQDKQNSNAKCYYINNYLALEDMLKRNLMVIVMENHTSDYLTKIILIVIVLV